MDFHIFFNLKLGGQGQHAQISALGEDVCYVLVILKRLLLSAFACPPGAADWEGTTNDKTNALSPFLHSISNERREMPSIPISTPAPLHHTLH